MADSENDGIRLFNDGIRLFVVEEQSIYRDLYRSILPVNGRIELVEVILSMDSLEEKIANVLPHVLMLSIKKTTRNIIEQMEAIRTAHCDLGIVLFPVSCNVKAIERIKRLAFTGGGMAVFLKQSLDTAEQIYNIVAAVSQRQIILDPALSKMFLNDRDNGGFLKELTERERQILGLLSRGYTNSKIAAALYIDVKTVEHHINSMYGKVKTRADFNEKHARVSAARLYLEATGELAPVPVAAVN